MAIEQKVERLSKVLALLTDLMKFCVLAVLSAFAVAAIANPSWAQRRLKALNLQVKEINIAGVKLVANESFDVANSLVDTQIDLEAASTQLSSSNNSPGPGISLAEASVKAALKRVDEMQVAMRKQENAIKETAIQAGLPTQDIPTSGWIFVGRFSEGGTFTPGPRVDPKETIASKGKLVRLQIRYDAPIVSDGESCVRTQLSDFQPPSADDLKRIQVLLRAEPYAPLKVLATAECPSAGKGKWLYAKIEILKDRVRFAKFSEIPN
ncbi:MAG: hypothetical protein HZB40_11210 [Rhodocyclales bacterium]|nr:hypothetical protein [Rhodocyclales bacterium]